MSSPVETQRCEECRWVQTFTTLPDLFCTDSRKIQETGVGATPIGCPYYERKVSPLRRLWNWMHTN